ncbi:hypothetical protein VTJ83DRAFT_1799 [Remersonia thermophila]|uniref:FAS1 domain-containing protein n=1 Tax=Remersonia thermophila TaxID=72144 RepID=A0ABR4DGX4_9PEZI
MRQAVLWLSAAAAAAAVAIPSSHEESQQPSAPRRHARDEQDAVRAWWDALPDAQELFSSIDDAIVSSKLDGFLELGRDQDGPHPHPPHDGHGHHGHHGDPQKTLYELIKESNHTTKFAKLVDEHEDVKKLLQDTEHSYTLFVPTDQAIDRIHHGHGDHGHGDHGHGDHGKGGGDGDDGDDGDDGHRHDHCKEFIAALLKYHIVPGRYSRSQIHHSRTLPSSLHPPALSASSSSSSSASSKHHHHDQPQRIRAFTTFLLHRTRLNFYARLVAGDFPAKNGLIHAVSAPLVPPPSQTALLRALPRAFSTLALALESTGLAKELDELPRSGGGTFFAPTNRAWAKLGPRVNAFLFSKRGEKWLDALVRYHVVVNETLYSDAYYREHHEGDHGDDDDDDDGKEDQERPAGLFPFPRHGRPGRGGEQPRYKHVDLPSLLHDKPLSVDIKDRHGFVSIVVNGFTHVVVRDGLADDGVIHAVDRVLIPHHGGHHGGHGGHEAEEEDEEEQEEMSVEDLKRRLAPFVKEEEEREEAEEMDDL